MSLEKILERIHLLGEQQAAEITRRAEEEACTLLEQARQKAGIAYQEAMREAQLPAGEACAHLRNEARFEANCVMGQAREHFVDSVIDSLRARLACLRASNTYAQVVRRQLREVLPPQNGSVPAGERITLQADPRDRDLLAGLLREAGLEIEVWYTLECLGGLNAYSPGRGSTVVNTLDSRLERAMPYLRRELARQFEEYVADASEPVTQAAGKGKPE